MLSLFLYTKNEAHSTCNDSYYTPSQQKDSYRVGKGLFFVFFLFSLSYTSTTIPVCREHHLMRIRNINLDVWNCKNVSRFFIIKTNLSVLYVYACQLVGYSTWSSRSWLISDSVASSVIKQIWYSGRGWIQHIGLVNAFDRTVVVSNPGAVPNVEGICDIMAFARFFSIVVSHGKQFVLPLFTDQFFRSVLR